MSLEAMRIAVLARRMVPDAPAVADAWYRLVEAIDAGWIDLRTLDRMAAGLDAGVGMGMEEFDLEVEGDDVVVTMVREEERCGRAAFADAVRALARAVRGGEGAGERGYAAGRVAAEQGAEPVADDVAAVVVAVRDALVGAQPAGGSAPPEELRSTVAMAREVARRLRAGEALDGLDLPGPPRALTAAEADRLAVLAGQLEGAAATALASDPDALTKAAQALTRWLAGDAAAGRELDAIVARLDGAEGAAAGPTPAERVREGARAAIAASLRRSGFDPTRGR